VKSDGSQKPSEELMCTPHTHTSTEKHVIWANDKNHTGTIRKAFAVV